MDFPERIHTPRLVLRRWTEDDEEAMAGIWADPEVWRSLRPGQRFDRGIAAERLAHHLRHWEEHGFGIWAAELVDGGEVAGWAGPAHPTFVPEIADRVEIAWTLRRPFWGRGLGTEAARAAIYAAFAALALPEVISLIHSSNRRSIAVAGRVGLRHRGEVLHPELGEPLRVYQLGAGPGPGCEGGAG